MVLEATYGWYWAVDALQRGRPRASGAPVGGEGVRVPAGEERRARRCGSGRSAADGSAARGVDRPAGHPGAARAGPAPGQAGRAAAGCKAEVHAVLAKCGVQVLMSDLFGLEGTAAAGPAGPAGAVRGPDRVAAPADRRPRVRDRPVRRHDPRPAGRRPGYTAVQTIPGIGPDLAAVFVAEIGDVTGSPPPRSWPRGPG